MLLSQVKYQSMRGSIILIRWLNSLPTAFDHRNQRHESTYPHASSPSAVFSLDTLYFEDQYFFHYITLSDLVDYVQPLVDFSEDGMVTVEVLCILAVVADEKL